MMVQTILNIAPNFYWYAIESDIDSANSLSDNDPPKKKRKQAEANSVQKSNGMFITYLFHSYN